MATTEQWIKCTQAQKDELNNLYDIARRYRTTLQRKEHDIKTRQRLIKRVDLGLFNWVHPVHVRYEAARELLLLNEWMNTDGEAMRQTLTRLTYAIGSVLREAEQGHEQRQLALVGDMFPGLTTDEQRREALHLLKGSKS